MNNKKIKQLTVFFSVFLILFIITMLFPAFTGFIIREDLPDSTNNSNIAQNNPQLNFTPLDFNEDSNDEDISGETNSGGSGGGSGGGDGSSNDNGGGEDGGSDGESNEEEQSQIWQREKLNVIVIETDDQRWDTLWAMPFVQEELMQKGVVFENAFASTPLCCPSRSSLLSGGFYSFNTGVISNNPPNGGVTKFNDTETLPILLQKDGYKTGIIGKYLNGYEKLAPYVPPGWDSFNVASTPGNWTKYTIVIGNSTFNSSGTGIKTTFENGTHLIYYQRDLALEFIDNYANDSFFLFLSTNAPHEPAIPLEGDEELFANYTPRIRGWGEENLTDKPLWVNEMAENFWNGNESIYNETDPYLRYSQTPDEFARDQLRSLQAVDRSVKDIIVKLEQRNLLNKTVIIFVSDNGFMWGEHKLHAKDKPYEESIRVPFIIRIPTIEPQSKEELTAIDLDVAQTIFEIANITRPSDGQSVLPLIVNSSYTWRENILLQSVAGTNKIPSWAALRDKKWKYVEYITEEKELYDLENDPFELENKINDSNYYDIATNFSAQLQPLKGLTIRTLQLPNATKDEFYSLQLDAWGGHVPYTWSIYNRTFHFGLTLHPDGVINGTPETKGKKIIDIKVEDVSVSPYHGGSQAFIRDFILYVND